MAKSTPELIIDQIEAILEAATWVNITTPDIFKGLTIWDPATQPLPLITIIPRPEKADTDKYGGVSCTKNIEITALIPMDTAEAPIYPADTAMVGEAVAMEIRALIFGSRVNGKWAGFPDELTNIRYVEGGVFAYPDELNPQLMSAGITIEVKYDVELYPDEDE